MKQLQLEIDIENKEKKKTKEKKVNEKKERRYDERNKLNDLTGAEWQFSTKTVISKIYPSNLQHKLRSQHGGQKPPELCADLIKIFSKKGQKVLDPLAGVGGTLLGAALCEREAIGIELNQKWIDIYNNVGKSEYNRLLDYCKFPNVELRDYEEITLSFDQAYKTSNYTDLELNTGEVLSKNKLISNG